MLRSRSAALALTPLLAALTFGMLGTSHAFADPATPVGVAGDQTDTPSTTAPFATAPFSTAPFTPFSTAPFTPFSTDEHPAPPATGQPPTWRPVPISPRATTPPAGTSLTVTVAHSTVRGHNGRFTLTCQPIGGSHPDPVHGCARLEQFSAAGNDPFAPVASGRACPVESGGPAIAQVTGEWGGRPINATFSRDTGCQTSRWNSLVPVLPPESPTTG